LFGNRVVKTPVYETSLLTALNEISGPAIIEAPTTTIKVDARWNLKVDTMGSYLLWKKGTQLHRIIARLMHPDPLVGSRQSKMRESTKSVETSVR